MLRKLGSIINLPIIDLTSGSQITVVKDFILDSEKEVLRGIKGESNELFAFENIQSVGNDAIIVVFSKEDKTSNKAIEEIKPPMFVPQDIFGMEVMTQSGQTIGAVFDIIVESKTGRIKGFEISDGILKDLVVGRLEVSLSEIITFGEDVIVINEPIEERYNVQLSKL